MNQRVLPKVPRVGEGFQGVGSDYMRSGESENSKGETSRKDRSFWSWGLTNERA